MSSEFLVQTADKKVYEISDIVKSCEWEDPLNNGAGKLTFAYLDTELAMGNGSIVRFKYDGVNIFYGIVFKHEHTAKRIATATAYDLLRYCKAKDTIVVSGHTISGLVKVMCEYFNLPIGTLTNSVYKLSTSVQSNKAWLDIVYTAIQDTLKATGKWYCLRDEFGKICLRNLTELESNLVIGDESLCTDYTFSKSIDDNYYNQIKLAVDNEVTGKRDIYTARDSRTINLFGLLQYYDVMSFSSTSQKDMTSTSENAGKPSAANEAKKKAIAIQMSNALLSLYNGETQSFSLSCIGDTSIRAGSSFHVYLPEININNRLIVKTATHTFLPNHTMKLEVRI